MMEVSSLQTIPPYRNKTVKPKKRNRKVLTLILFFFFVIAIIAFFNSPISKITKIEVKGNQLVSEQRVYEQGHLRLNMQYFFIQTKSLEEQLAQMKEIKKVEVIKKFPGYLEIKIVENQPIAYLNEKDNEWQPMLENGYLVPSVQKKQFMSGPFITEWKEKEKLVQLATELKKIQPSVLERISEIRQNGQATDPSELLLIMNEGYKIHVPLEKLGMNMNLYPGIIESVKEKTTRLGEIYMLESIRFEEYKNSGDINESE